MNEVDKYMAEKVLGWVPKFEPPAKGYWYATPDDKDIGPLVDEWQPTGDLHQALRCLNALKNERGIAISFSNSGITILVHELRKGFEVKDIRLLPMMICRVIHGVHSGNPENLPNLWEDKK